VLVAEELVQIVLVDIEAVDEVAVAAVAYAAEENAGEAEEKQQGKDTSAEATAIAWFGRVRLHVLVVGPLEEHDDTGADEEHGPEASVPVPETVSREAAGLYEQKEDADGDQEQRPKDGAAPEAASLIAVCVTLSAGYVTLGARLLFEDATLVFPVATVWRPRWWRVWWRWVASHGLVSFLVVMVGGNNRGAGSCRWWR